MRVSEVLDKFIFEKTIIGSTEKTIFYYEQQVGFFVKFVKDIEIENITYSDYQEYIYYLRNKKNKLSTVTIRTYARAVKVFLKWCYEHKYINKNISLQITLPKQMKKEIDILSNEEIAKIINNYNRNCYIDKRNLLIISLMLDCGMRISELSNLKYSDFDIEKSLIKVNGKGQKQRYVPLSETTEKFLNGYLKFISLERTDYLLMEIDKKTNMSINSIRLIIRRLRYKLKIEKLHPHLLRHTFATLFIVNGGDSLSLKQILGHTTFYMVDNYCHLASAIFIARNKTFAPLSNIKNKKD